jgi:hypothetical protein
MIPTTSESKPIECSPEDELLAVAYSIIRQTRHYLNLLEHSVSATADLKSAARDFCLTFETRFRPAPGRPSLAPMPAIPAIVTQPFGDVRAESVAGNSTSVSD